MTTQEAAVRTQGDAGMRVEQFDTVVIGGGQAGLAVGYYLKKQGGSFVILDANERIGGSWRTRTWDSLRLFTPARYDGLPGWPFPMPGWVVSDRARDGRLPRGVCGSLRSARAQRDEGHPAHEGRRPLRRRVR
jgi:hypothetical protein